MNVILCGVSSREGGPLLWDIPLQSHVMCIVLCSVGFSLLRDWESPPMSRLVPSHGGPLQSHVMCIELMLCEGTSPLP